MEPHPARLLEVLRECGALARAPARSGRAVRRGAATRTRTQPAGCARLIRALDYAADAAFALPVRYAVLAHRLGATSARSAAGAAEGRARRSDVAAAPSGSPSGSRCRSTAATRRASRRAGIASCRARNRSRRRPCSISSTPPTRCVVRSASRRCCRRASATRCRRPAPPAISRPRRIFARRSTS